MSPSSAAPDRPSDPPRETSPPPSGDEDVPAGEERRPAATLVETTKCPNCSRRFVGQYCPECGQKQGPASVVDLVSGFAREVVDLDRGFWPTLKNLTIRPGHMLRRYLQGARRSYMHPGRYLLAAIVVATLITQLMGQVGLTTGAGPADVASGDAAASDSATATADPDSVDTSSFGYKLGYALGRTAVMIGMKEDSGSGSAGGAFEEEETAQRAGPSNLFSVLGNHYARMFFAVTTAMFLGLVYRRMFPGALPRVAPAVAIAMFVVAHVTLLQHALNVPITLLQYTQTGEPVGPGSNGLSLLLLFLGSGVAARACFGQREGAWRAGFKGGLAVAIALVDTLAVLALTIAVYVWGQSFWTPGVIPPDHPLFWFLSIAAVMGIAVLFLPHLGLIFYRRVRSKGLQET